ncbi:MAG: diacylglycerol kinase family lipid kinase [Bacteroidota bacterium]|nr:diacylglycerol kinase family lipid kinase [Bacteroidota bacterium]
MNKKAGSSEDNTEELIKKYFEESKVRCEVFSIEGSEIQNKVKELSEQQFDIIVAAGGDGTVSSVAGILAGGNIPLGVLPCGTLNHFAKDIGMPLELEDAIKVIIAGNVVMLDIAEVNGRKFINNSSIGLYADTVKKREAEQKHLYREKWAAMISAFFHSFKRFSLYGVEMKVKEKKTRLYTALAFVGNNKYTTELKNPGGRDRLDEGILSLYMTKCKTRFCLIKIFLSSLINKHEKSEDFVMHYTENVVLKTYKKFLDVSVDGEVVRMNSPLLYKIIPKSLPVVVPVKK